MFKNNPWELNDSIREKYTPIIQETINTIKNSPTVNELDFDFTGEQLNPTILCKLLEELGYKPDRDYLESDSESDIYCNFTQDGWNKMLVVYANGLTFELHLYEDINEEDDNEVDYQYAKPMIPFWF